MKVDRGQRAGTGDTSKHQAASSISPDVHSTPAVSPSPTREVPLTRDAVDITGGKTRGRWELWADEGCGATEGGVGGGSREWARRVLVLVLCSRVNAIVRDGELDL